MTAHVSFSRLEQVQLVVGRTIQAVLLGEFIAGLLTANWWLAFVTAQAIVASVLPAILARNTRLNAPAGFQLTVILFIFATIFLGEVHQYYERFWWWDMMLHASSGLILGWVAFLFLFTLFDYQRVNMPPILLSCFAVAFAMATGTLWEIFEFIVDKTMGMEMQRGGLSDASGLEDTMSDHIVNALGASIAVAIAYWRVTRQRGRHWVKAAASEFLDEQYRPSVPKDAD